LAQWIEAESSCLLSTPHERAEDISMDMCGKWSTIAGGRAELQ